MDLLRPGYLDGRRQSDPRRPDFPRGREVLHALFPAFRDGVQHPACQCRRETPHLLPEDGRPDVHRHPASLLSLERGYPDALRPLRNVAAAFPETAHPKNPALRGSPAPSSHRPGCPFRDIPRRPLGTGAMAHLRPVRHHRSELRHLARRCGKLQGGASVPPPGKRGKDVGVRHRAPFLQGPRPFPHRLCRRTGKDLCRYQRLRSPSQAHPHLRAASRNSDERRLHLEFHGRTPAGKGCS